MHDHVANHHGRDACAPDDCGIPGAAHRLQGGFEIMKPYSILFAIVASLLISSCKKAEIAGDVSLARETFGGLVRGDSAVKDKIDWPVFTSLGTNTGAAYTLLNSAVEKEKFVEGFVTQFSSSFRESGGIVEDFTNWRVISHDSAKTEVAADSSKGVLTVIVSERDNVERVSSINIIR